VQVYDVDGVAESAGAGGGSQVLSAVPAAGTRGILAAAAHQRESGHNGRFYDEQEYERRLKRRRARLIVAAEEAFTHIKRLQREPSNLVLSCTLYTHGPVHMCRILWVKSILNHTLHWDAHYVICDLNQSGQIDPMKTLRADWSDCDRIMF